MELCQKNESYEQNTTGIFECEKIHKGFSESVKVYLIKC